MIKYMKIYVFSKWKEDKRNMSKRKKLIQIIILVAMLLGITGIVRYNYEMYDSDIARVVDADNKEDDSGEEPRYTQKLTLKIKNHEHKGALDRFKFEVANELGVPLTDGYNGV